jgi:hypothetical protein
MIGLVHRGQSLKIFISHVLFFTRTLQSETATNSLALQYSSDDILGTWETAECTLFLRLRSYVRPVRGWVLPLARSETVHSPTTYKLILLQVKIFIYRNKKLYLYK